MPDLNPLGPFEPARPEPVLDEARITARLLTVLSALATILAGLGLQLGTDVNGLLTALVVIAGGVISVINYLVPLWRAHVARAQVTPIKDPVDVDGTQLVRVDMLKP